MFWKKNKKKSLKKYVLIILLVMLLIPSFILVKSDVFRIKEVIIKSSEINCVNNSSLKDLLKLEKKIVFFVDESQIKKNIKGKYYCIKDIIITYQIPYTVYAEIIKRESRAKVVSLTLKESSLSAKLEEVATPSAQDYLNIFLIDDEGILFSKENSATKFPEIFIYDRELNLGQSITSISGGIFKIFDTVGSFGINIDSVKIFFDKFLITESLPKIAFNLEKDLDKQLASLQLILGQAKIDSAELVFIDLRFDKPVVRYGKGQNHLRN